MEIEGHSSLDDANLSSHVMMSPVIHIYGAGLNTDRPAHTAVGELKRKGWACAPIHPRDAGATIDGFPIRPFLDDGLSPRVIVLFLAPERARSVVRDLIVRLDHEAFPLIWFQRGAEDDQSIEALESMNAPYVVNDCIVEYTGRNKFSCSIEALPQTFCLQTASEDGDGCSVWTVHSSQDAQLSPPTHALEWVGSLDDLAYSQHTIPRYIRSLRIQDESTHALAKRLTKPEP